MILTLLSLIILPTFELHVLSLPSVATSNVYLLSSLDLSLSAVTLCVILLLLIFCVKVLIYQTFNSSWDTLSSPLQLSISIMIGLLLGLFIVKCSLVSQLKNYFLDFFSF